MTADLRTPSSSNLPETADSHAPVNPSDILSRIRSRIADMSDNQKRVAQLFLDEPQWAVHANVEGIAARAFVSPPTIVRFARKVGCEGLRDLKLKLAGALALGAPFLHRAVHIGDSAADVLRNVTGSITTVLAEWQQHIDPELLSRAASAVHHSKQIVCLGTGALSNFLAQDLQARLYRLGHSAQSFSDAHYQLVASAALNSGDVLFAVSFVGRMPTLLRAVEVAKSHGATVIAITQSGTALAGMADIVLAMDVPSDTTMLVGTDAYVVQLITIEVLMILVGLKQGPRLNERMQEIHKVLRTYSVDTADPSILHSGWRQMLGEVSEK